MSSRTDGVIAVTDLSTISASSTALFKFLSGCVSNLLEQLGKALRNSLAHNIIVHGAELLPDALLDLPI
jgi:hypothetical protein